MSVHSRKNLGSDDTSVSAVPASMCCASMVVRFQQPKLRMRRLCAWKHSPGICSSVLSSFRNAAIAPSVIPAVASCKKSAIRPGPSSARNSLTASTGLPRSIASTSSAAYGSATFRGYRATASGWNRSTSGPIPTAESRASTGLRRATTRTPGDNRPFSAERRGLLWLCPIPIVEKAFDRVDPFVPQSTLMHVPYSSIPFGVNEKSTTDPHPLIFLRNKKECA